MGFRVSLFLTQQVGARSAGWTMNFWNNLTDLSGVTTATRALAVAVFDFTGGGVSVVGARIADLSAFRAAQPIVYSDLASVVDTTLNTADYPTTKGLLRLFGPTKYLANMWIGTLPDGSTTTGGVYTPRPSDVNRFNQLRAILADPTQGWSLFSQDKTTAKTNVTAITAPGVVTAPGHGLLTGDKTRISRTKGIAALNRIWLVTKIDNDSFQLVAPPAGGFVGSLTAPGFSQKQGRIMLQIADARIIRTTEHKVGRPFGLFSGRRKARKT